MLSPTTKGKPQIHNLNANYAFTGTGGEVPKSKRGQAQGGCT
jgi:hypothetical protein